MSAIATLTSVGAVDNAGEAGERIKARRVKLGMSVKGLAERANIDRGRLAAIEAGDATVRPATVGAVESALDRLEQEMGMDDPPIRAIGNPEDDLVEFTIEGNFGVRAVVKGPVRDLDALQAAVAKLVQDMQRDQPKGGDSENS